jgi:CRP/FNR family transcriptional regulator, cyclic AMP receptor protein
MPAPASQPDPLQALPEPLRALAARGTVRRYARAVHLIQEGEEGDTLFIIVSGRLRAYSANDKGREITHGIYGPGEYLGEMSLDGGPRSASVVTLEPSQCAVVTRRTLEAFIAERPAFAFELLTKVIRRARAATLSLTTVALNDVYGRLKLLLERLAQPADDGTWQVPERLTHQDIANRLGCGREMVSRLMKDLEAGGYVRLDDGGRVRVLKRLPTRW